jgi:hypothetical protein
MDFPPIERLLFNLSIASLEDQSIESAHGIGVNNTPVSESPRKAFPVDLDLDVSIKIDGPFDGECVSVCQVHTDLKGRQDVCSNY